MARIDSFLRLVVEQRASDLHLCAGAPPTVRVHGELVPLPFRTLSDLEARRLILEILTDTQRNIVETEKDLDIVHEIDGSARFRGNVFFHKYGLGVVWSSVAAAASARLRFKCAPSSRKIFAARVRCSAARSG